MSQVSIFDVVADVALGNIIKNENLNASVREGAADLIKEGYVTADVMAIAKGDGEMELVLVPNEEQKDNSPVWKRLAS